MSIAYMNMLIAWSIAVKDQEAIGACICKVRTCKRVHVSTLIVLNPRTHTFNVDALQFQDQEHLKIFDKLMLTIVLSFQI